MAAAYELFVAIEQAPAMQAVAELSAEGREFSPAPGVVLARTLQIVVASTPQLQDPDLTRDLTPEEQERAKRMSASLTGNRARLVQATWLVFAQHARIALAPGESAELAADRIKASDCPRLAGAHPGGRPRLRSPWIRPRPPHFFVTRPPLPRPRRHAAL